MEMNSKSLSPTTETLPSYINPEQMIDLNNVRLRHIKSNIPIQKPSQPAHLILSTGDFPSNEKDNDIHHSSKNKHNKTQMILIIFTALSYLLYTLRSYIPENLQTSSKFWSHIKPIPIPRIYTSDLRPNLQIENFLLHSAEICQTIWLIYILSFLARRTHLGYLYRNPNIFNSILCSLLLIALFLQAISQTFLPPEISFACLFLSSILLILTCRLISLKLIKYEEKFNSIDLIILRYFILNNLFLYTTSIIYLTICSSIECFAFHLDLNIISLSFIITISLSIGLIFILIYFFLDQFIYNNEFQSIWTPYLFLAIIFYYSSMNQLLKQEIDWNIYLFWSIFIIIIFLILIRISRKIYLKYRQRKNQLRISQFLDQKLLKTEN